MFVEICFGVGTDICQRIPCLVESGPKQLLPTKTAHIKGYLAECLSQWKMCGTEVGEMNEIHVYYCLCTFLPLRRLSKE